MNMTIAKRMEVRILVKASEHGTKKKFSRGDPSCKAAHASKTAKCEEASSESVLAVSKTGQPATEVKIRALRLRSGSLCLSKERRDEDGASVLGIVVALSSSTQHHWLDPQRYDIS